MSGRVIMRDGKPKITYHQLFTLVTKYKINIFQEVNHDEVMASCK